MTDRHPPAPPPLPERSASEAARAATPSASASRPAYDPATDPDDTGVPTAHGRHPAGIDRGFFSALFDLTFRTFITRRLASAFYFIGLIAIGIAFLVYFVSGIVNGALVLPFSLGGGIAAIVATVIIVPLITFLAIIALRFIIEGIVALIAIAENTERTAENTRS